MSKFHLTVSSPDGNKFDGEVFKFDVRGVEGELAIMAGHIPFITSVIKAPCTVWLDEDKKKTADSEESTVYRGWGIGIRTPTNRVRVCRATVTLSR